MTTIKIQPVPLQWSKIKKEYRWKRSIIPEIDPNFGLVVSFIFAQRFKYDLFSAN